MTVRLKPDTTALGTETTSTQNSLNSQKNAYCQTFVSARSAVSALIVVAEDHRSDRQACDAL